MPVYLGNESINPPLKRLLFRRVVVILIVGGGLGTIEAERVGRPVSVHGGIQGIRIAVEQTVRIAIHRRCSCFGDKARLS